MKAGRADKRCRGIRHRGSSHRPLSLWERVRVRAVAGDRHCFCRAALTPALSQREREKSRPAPIANRTSSSDDGSGTIAPARTLYDSAKFSAGVATIALEQGLCFHGVERRETFRKWAIDEQGTRDRQPAAFHIDERIASCIARREGHDARIANHQSALNDRVRRQTCSRTNGDHPLAGDPADANVPGIDCQSGRAVIRDVDSIRAIRKWIDRAADIDRRSGGNRELRSHFGRRWGRLRSRSSASRFARPRSFRRPCLQRRSASNYSSPRKPSCRSRSKPALKWCDCQSPS